MNTAIRKPMTLVAALAIALVLAFSGTTPANAAAAAGASVHCEGADCVQGYASVTNVAYDGVFGVVEFQCALSAPGAASVAITSCSADRLTAPTIAMPGSAVATVGFGTIEASGAIEICWSGNATFILGGENVATSGCSIVSLGVELPPENIDLKEILASTGG